MGASSSHARREIDGRRRVVLALLLVLLAVVGACAITFRSPGAPGTDTTSSGTADTTSYCLRSADVVPKDLFQRPAGALRGAWRRQPELRVVGAVERAAPD